MRNKIIYQIKLLHSPHFQLLNMYMDHQNIYWVLLQVKQDKLLQTVDLYFGIQLKNHMMLLKY